jgi:N-formylglutamate amidohydrolase
MFRPTSEHKEEVSAIYDRHHALLNRRAAELLQEHGRCLIIDLHSFSDETVNRLFGWTDFPDVCIGTEPDYYSEELVQSIIRLCKGMGLSVALNYPYCGSLVPNQYYGKKDTA